jgi:hypothetical protein
LAVSRKKACESKFILTAMQSFPLIRSAMRILVLLLR